MSLMTASESLLRRIRYEFGEHAGLRLTPWQFRQKWALAPNESRIVMQRLLDAGFLREAEDGTLVRDESWTPTGVKPSAESSSSGLGSSTS
jgi:hypothetical protein